MILPIFLKPGCNPCIYPPGKEPSGLEPPISLKDAKSIVIDSSLACGIDESRDPSSEHHDKTVQIRDTFLSGTGWIRFTRMRLPFSASESLLEVHVCVGQYDGPPLMSLILTCADGSSHTKRYQFSRPTHSLEWYSLPVHLKNVVECEIYVQENWIKDTLYGVGYAWLHGIRFVRGEFEEKTLKKAK
ncbi:hypothetical protein ADUPG1_000106 [Aduncisulcus paluster]|uniref:Uncharacterized protein n=1 Tax=Aduncisulcus paluster TaxID=2918883 RepID=A0ABQ5K6W5_9EUKA|nr:hypothetical protein ADUPG1_000106 [Aduncisulcus paluster]